MNAAMNWIRKINWIRSHANLGLIVCGFCILGTSLWLSSVSPKFDIEAAFKDRPVAVTVSVLIAASIVWLFACWLVWGHKADSKKSRTSILFWIIGIGIASRIALVISTPILELSLIHISEPTRPY